MAKMKRKTTPSVKPIIVKSAVKKKRPIFLDERGKFKKGFCPNPLGRPKGVLSGRMQAVTILDRILANAKNQQIMERRLTEKLRKDPVWFFRALVIPLVPKEQVMKLETAERSPVRVTFTDEE